jgi:CheY-like chemotaxis protein/HPt (histidine-containing phosphotransfer) domain-containing protein
MSHEMRTPLNAIIGFAELELENEQQLHSETHESLEKIYTSGLTMLGIVNDILDISKIESGHLELVPVEYDTPSLINDTIMLNIVRIGSKPISFELDIEENLPSKLFGDELRIKQVLNNLLSNSFKYTKEGKVTLKIRSERSGDSVLVSCTISDTGIGIHQEDLDKLFSDYNQVDTKSNRNIEGTGLGLALTKRLLDMMGGDITVSSVYGQGSTFEVHFKQGFVNAIPIGKELADNLKKFQYAKNRRDRNKQLVRAWIPYAKVLVVDDVATNLDVAKGMLKPYGMTVACVKSGPAAINLIREEDIKFNAIFMDHMMPGMDGIEAVRIIRNEINTEYAKTIPIIALTANAIVGNEEMFLKNGFQAFLTKPIDIIRMNDAINHWVRDKEYEKNLRQSQGIPENAPQGSEEQEVKSENTGGKSLNHFLIENPIEGLDHQKALLRFGSADIYLVSLRSYTAHTPALLIELREKEPAGNASPSPEDLEQYRITVHGIKGSSYGISADEAGRQAEALEKAAKESNLDFIRKHSGGFIQYTENFIALVTEFLERIDARVEKPKKTEPDKTVLRQICKAADSYNMGELDKAIEELEQYSYESNGDLVPWLREQLGMAEFEQITERLKDY